MVTFRAYVLFTLLLCCSASRSNRASHYQHHAKQQYETKHNAREEAGVSRRGFWTALLALLSASVGDAFVIGGIRPAAAPGLSVPQLHSPRINVSMVLPMLPRRAVLASGLLGSIGVALPGGVPQFDALSDKQVTVQTELLTTNQIQELRGGVKELTKKQIQKVRSVLNSFDNGAGFVDTQEFRDALRALGYPEDDIQKAMQKVIMKVAERRGLPERDFRSFAGGEIDVEELLHVIRGIRSPRDPNGFPMRDQYDDQMRDPIDAPKTYIPIRTPNPNEEPRGIKVHSDDPKDPTYRKKNPNENVGDWIKDDAIRG